MGWPRSQPLSALIYSAKKVNAMTSWPMRRWWTGVSWGCSARSAPYHLGHRVDAPVGMLAERAPAVLCACRLVDQIPPNPSGCSSRSRLDRRVRIGRHCSSEMSESATVMEVAPQPAYEAMVVELERWKGDVAESCCLMGPDEFENKVRLGRLAGNPHGLPPLCAEDMCRARRPPVTGWQPHVRE